MTHIKAVYTVDVTARGAQARVHPNYLRVGYTYHRTFKSYKECMEFMEKEFPYSKYVKPNMFDQLARVWAVLPLGGYQPG